MKRMMEVLFITCFILFLVSCGKAAHDLVQDYGPLKPSNQPRPQYFHDPDLQGFADQYLQVMKDNGIDTSNYGHLIRLEYIDGQLDKKETTIGLCNTYEDNRGLYYTIKIKRLETNSFCNRAITFHELGHCVNNLKHSSKPGSIMYPELTLDCTQYMDDNWDRLVTEHVQYIKDCQAGTCETVKEEDK